MVLMVYPVALVNVSLVSLRCDKIDFYFIFIAGRDGIKGGRGDNGRPGKEIIDYKTNYIFIFFIFQVILAHLDFPVHKVS